MKGLSLDFLQFLPLETGKRYAFVGDVSASTEALVLFTEKTSKLENDVCVVETTEEFTIVQAVTVRDARLASDGGLYDGVIAFNTGPSSTGHVKSLCGEGAFFLHACDGVRAPFDAIKGK